MGMSLSGSPPGFRQASTFFHTTLSESASVSDKHQPFFPSPCPNQPWFPTGINASSPLPVRICLGFGLASALLPLSLSESASVSDWHQRFFPSPCPNQPRFPTGISLFSPPLSELARFPTGISPSSPPPVRISLGFRHVSSALYPGKVEHEITSSVSNN
ncbi:hypothetical protein J2Z37_004754 [Ammoniphilus resinae]|uniref:Uncharacterized protein n=1 Tax=Ammoniphilus resinae TaxID=861532 RepID=A0ABS4GWU3_9BACL|nr:hypothetical protein [Ammoniphilus resinae]